MPCHDLAHFRERLWQAQAADAWVNGNDRALTYVQIETIWWVAAV
jgi:hypothetical protein